MVKLWAEIITSQPFFQNKFVLSRPGAVNFVGIITIAITLIKTRFKNSINVKQKHELCIKMHFFSLFFHITKIVCFCRKMMNIKIRTFLVKSCKV